MTETTLRDAVLIPAAQAVITGTLTGILAGSLAAIAGLDQPTAIGGAAAGAISLASWLTYRGDWKGRIEAAQGITPPPTAAPELIYAQDVRLAITSEDGRACDYVHLPGIDAAETISKLQAFARGIAAGRSLAIHAWTGNGRPFTRPEYEEMRSQLTERGFLRPINPNAPQLGVTPTAKGRALFQTLAAAAEEPTSPTAIPASRIQLNPGRDGRTYTSTQKGKWG